MSERTPLRVCHLGKYYPPAPGGIETHAQTLARAQARLGADVQVVCVNHVDRRGRDVSPSRYGATRTESGLDGPVSVTRLGRSATFARLDICPTLPWVIKQLNHRPVDLLHLHTPNPTMVLTVAGLLRKDIPLVISHHSDIVRQRLLRWLHRPFERMVYRRAAAVLASSPMYVAGSPMLREHEPKVHAVPMGIDPDRYDHPTPAALAEMYRLRRDLGEVIWLAVGRCVYYKGLHIAIEALPRVPGRLLIIGHGPLVHELRGLARQRGVADRVTWKHYATSDELAGAYLAATAVWFPSSQRSEAFGLVQLEAMASGCPVVNTDLLGSGVPWVCQHEQSGLTVPVNDPIALAAAARRLLNEPGLRRRLAEGGRRRVRQEFDESAMARRVLSIYRRVIERRMMIAAPVHSRLREWVQRSEDDGDGERPATTSFAHARLAPLRGESVRRG